MKEIRKEEFLRLQKEGKGKMLKRSRHKYYIMEDDTLLEKPKKEGRFPKK